MRKVPIRQRLASIPPALSLRNSSEAYAEEIWTSTDWTKEPDIQNFYDSKSVIKHREHNDTNMGVFYVCVKAREPRATILEKLIDVTSGGNESSGQFLTYPQHDALRQKDQ